MVFKENNPLSEVAEEGIKAFATLNDETARHAANDLCVYIAVHVRMKPKQTDVLCRDRDLIREGLSRANMQEDIVAISERGNAEPVEVQVRWFGKAVMKGNRQRIAQADAPHCRRVRAVVEHALKLMATDRVCTRRRDQLDIQPPIATGKHRRIRKDAVLALRRLDFAPQYGYRSSKSEYRLNGFLYPSLPPTSNTDGQKITLGRGCQEPILAGESRLIIPYALDTNDFKFATNPGWMSGQDFFTYLKAAFDHLYREGEREPEMMSIGLHLRLIGRPARADVLARFMDYVQRHDQAWVCRRVEIARHWMQAHPPKVDG
jgi:hypothetical protein